MHNDTVFFLHQKFSPFSSQFCGSHSLRFSYRISWCENKSFREIVSFYFLCISWPTWLAPVRVIIEMNTLLVWFSPGPVGPPSLNVEMEYAAELGSISSGESVQGCVVTWRSQPWLRCGSKSRFHMSRSPSDRSSSTCHPEMKNKIINKKQFF